MLNPGDVKTTVSFYPQVTQNRGKGGGGRGEINDEMKNINSSRLRGWEGLWRGA